MRRSHTHQISWLGSKFNNKTGTTTTTIKLWYNDENTNTDKCAPSQIVSPVDICLCLSSSFTVLSSQTTGYRFVCLYKILIFSLSRFVHLIPNIGTRTLLCAVCLCALNSTQRHSAHFVRFSLEFLIKFYVFFFFSSCFVHAHLFLLTRFVVVVVVVSSFLILMYNVYAESVAHNYIYMLTSHTNTQWSDDYSLSLCSRIASIHSSPIHGMVFSFLVGHISLSQAHDAHDRFSSRSL